MSRISRYVWMGAAIGASYFISTFLVSNVFLNNSPKVDKYFVTRIGGKISRAVAYLISPKERDIQNSTNKVGQLASSPLLKEIAPGVRAASNEYGSYTEVTIGKMDYKAYTFTLKGRTVTINVPVGQPAPSQEDAEKLFE